MQCLGRFWLFSPFNFFLHVNLEELLRVRCCWSIVRLKLAAMRKKKSFQFLGMLAKKKKPSLKRTAMLNKVRPSTAFMCFLYRRWKGRRLHRRLWQWQHPGYSRRVPGEQRHKCDRLQEVPDGPLGSQGNHSNRSQLGGQTSGQRAGSDGQLWPRHRSG